MLYLRQDINQKPSSCRSIYVTDEQWSRLVSIAWAMGFKGRDSKGNVSELMRAIGGSWLMVVPCRIQSYMQKIYMLTNYQWQQHAKTGVPGALDELEEIHAEGARLSDGLDTDY